MKKAPPPIILHGFTLHPCRMRLHMLLTRIGSGMDKMVEILRQEMAGPVAEEANDAQSIAADLQKRVETRILREIGEDVTLTMETVFCFTRPAKQIEEILDKGRDVFRKTALEAMGELTVAQFQEMQWQVFKLYLDCVA
jgi:hypothetical protein